MPWCARAVDPSMPFTPTHVLAVLPVAAVKRLPLPFSALMIGSVVPDYPLFVSPPPDYGTTHSVPGVLTACLPLGVAGFLLFQAVMKRPLFALLPAAIRRRCAPLSRPRVEPTPRFFLRAGLAVVIGASTHLFWDSFTHQGRWGTSAFPQLNRTALTIGGHPVPGFKALQYGSTLIGLPCLGLLLAAWLVRRRPEPLSGTPTLPAPFKAVAYAVLSAAPAAATWRVWGRDGLSRYDRLGQSITASGLALAAVVLAYCLVFQAVEKRIVREG